jgi:hypothetical protein
MWSWRALFSFYWTLMTVALISRLKVQSARPTAVSVSEISISLVSRWLSFRSSSSVHFWYGGGSFLLFTSSTISPSFALIPFGWCDFLQFYAMIAVIPSALLQFVATVGGCCGRRGRFFCCHCQRWHDWWYSTQLQKKYEMGHTTLPTCPRLMIRHTRICNVRFRFFAS